MLLPVISVGSLTPLLMPHTYGQLSSFLGQCPLLHILQPHTSLRTKGYFFIPGHTPPFRTNNPIFPHLILEIPGQILPKPPNLPLLPNHPPSPKALSTFSATRAYLTVSPATKLPPSISPAAHTSYATTLPVFPGNVTVTLSSHSSNGDGCFGSWEAWFFLWEWAVAVEREFFDRVGRNKVGFGERGE